MGAWCAVERGHCMACRQAFLRGKEATKSLGVRRLSEN
jgi:hypothetical protein